MVSTLWLCFARFSYAVYRKGRLTYPLFLDILHQTFLFEILWKLCYHVGNIQSVTFSWFFRQYSKREFVISVCKCTEIALRVLVRNGNLWITASVSSYANVWENLPKETREDALFIFVTFRRLTSSEKRFERPNRVVPHACTVRATKTCAPLRQRVRLLYW